MPLPTLSDALRLDHALTVHCENHAWGKWGCAHSRELDVSALIERFGPDLPVVELNGRFRCEICGARGGVVHTTPRDVPSGGLPRYRSPAKKGEAPPVKTGLHLS